MSLIIVHPLKTDFGRERLENVAFHRNGTAYCNVMFGERLAIVQAREHKLDRHTRVTQFCNPICPYAAGN
jgi:hypothetical protein